MKPIMSKLGTIVIAGVVAAIVSLATASTQPAAATTPVVTDNPWTYQMTNAGQQGLIIIGPTTGNTQLLEIRDWAGNPIFACNAAGGCAVLGDNLSTFGGGDVFNPTNMLLENGGIQIGKGGPTLYGSAADPTGACTSGTWDLAKTGKLWACVNGAWARRA